MGPNKITGLTVISSPEPELIGWDSIRRPCRRVCPLTLSKMNISETSGPIAFKFYLKHHWGWGKGCMRFLVKSDQNSGFHGNRYLPIGYIEENLVTTLSSSFFIRSSSFLQVKRTTIRLRMRPNFGQIRRGTAELAARERLEKLP